MPSGFFQVFSPFLAPSIIILEDKGSIAAVSLATRSIAVPLINTLLPSSVAAFISFLMIVPLKTAISNGSPLPSVVVIVPVLSSYSIFVGVIT